MKEKWAVSEFGRDCMGNISGYQVYRYEGNLRVSSRKFHGDLYKPGSFEAARVAATQYAADLNTAVAA